MNQKIIIAIVLLLLSIIISTVFIKESFCIPVKAYNEFIDDKNDPNFPSDVMNTNIFFRNPGHIQNIIENIQNTPKQRTFEPDEWVYENEFVMNGGELLDNVKGYDTRYPYADSYPSKKETISSTCNPIKRGIQDDDIRMGLGIIQAENRFIR